MMDMLVQHYIRLLLGVWIIAVHGIVTRLDHIWRIGHKMKIRISKTDAAKFKELMDCIPNHGAEVHVPPWVSGAQHQLL